MKPGYQTTEFWLTTAATVLSALLASNVLPAAGPYGQVAGLIGTVILPTIYGYLRMMAKANAPSPTAPATLPEAAALAEALGAGKPKDPKEG